MCRVLVHNYTSRFYMFEGKYFISMFANSRLAAAGAGGPCWGTFSCTELHHNHALYRRNDATHCRTQTCAQIAYSGKPAHYYSEFAPIARIVKPSATLTIALLQYHHAKTARIRRQDSCNSIYEGIFLRNAAIISNHLITA